MIDIDKEGIPEELRKNKKWVGFKVADTGKKIPIDPNTLNAASISNPDTWGTFEQAIGLVEMGECVAPGYAITKDDGLIFIDLDCHTGKCQSEEEKKKLEMLYKSLCKSVAYFETYMETSLSGNGVHLLARGSLDDSLKRGSSPIAPVEIYDDSRFMIITGNRLNDCDISSEYKTIGSIGNLHKQFFQKKDTEGYVAEGKIISVSSKEKYSDAEVLRVAMKDNKFKLLWNDKWEQVKDKNGNPQYTQQHYADFALIRKLTYYTGNSPSQVERLFRQSPCYQAYGKNGKWEKYESDIRKDIETASKTCTAVYSSTAVSDGGEVAKIETAPLREWRPNFQKISEHLQSESCVFENPKLKTMLLDYVAKYSGRQGIHYLPYLFKEDRNINGCTAIVKKVLGENLKYSFQFGSYYLWDGKRFVNYGDSEMLIHPITEVLGMVEHSVFYWIMDYVAPSENKPALEEMAIRLFEDSKKYVSSKLAQDVLKKYKGMDLVADLAGYYETPYINMENGVLNLQTKELLPHAPQYRQHKITNCSFDPQAQCPEFVAMMERLVPDAAVRKELQKAFGLCLAKEQLPAKKVLMLLVGPKDTGKTTVLNAILNVLGEYGTSVDNSILMQSSKDKSRGPEMFDFRETLMITTSESNENDKLDTGRVKALTGETMQSVRNNYAVSMQKFKMIGLIFIDSNFRPYIPPRDTATWGRLRLFPFIHVVAEKDPTLKGKLEQEKSGIFNWILDGLNMVLEEKEIFETSIMLEYKGQYQKEMDTTQQFVADCLEPTDSKTDRIQTSILFSTYKNWCQDNGFRDSVRNKFYEEISKHFEKKKSGTEFFINVKFTPLGVLYSSMKEKTSQQFAKEKRVLLGGADTNLSYDVLKGAYFSKTKGWFINNVGSRDDLTVLLNRYNSYCDWCIDSGLIPIKPIDYNAKVAYLHDNLKTPVPDTAIMEKVKDVWSD